MIHNEKLQSLQIAVHFDYYYDAQIKVDEPQCKYLIARCEGTGQLAKYRRSCEDANAAV
jgi:hypothetical protein